MATESAGPEEFTPPVPDPREYVGPGVVLGVVAWILVYGLTLAVGVGLTAADALSVSGTDSTLLVGGWLFYSAHLAVAALAGGPLGANVVADGGGLLYAVALVPPVVLAAAGSMVVARVGVPGPVEGAKGGAAVALGYLVPTVAVALAVEGTVTAVGATYPMTPGLGAALAVGLVYPAVVGAVGGALSTL